MTETPIFPLSTKPVHEGVYKIHLTPVSGKDRIRWALWIGKKWKAFQLTKKQAAKGIIRSGLLNYGDSSIVLGWSGLSEPPK